MIGEVVKDYRILSFLGEGGMGTVYRAEHRLIGKPAVVKVLRPQMSADQAALRRFMNEAMAAARIGHPGIVAVFDFGYHTSGEAYIVMELLQGEPLSARIGRDGRLDIASTVLFLKQIASALSAAVREGIIHRDLKPDNIFLTPDPDMEGGERTKILDFGIAKIAGDPTAVQSLTRTNALMGTPYYMSPEQCRSARDTDHRSDLYAVGCIGYEMLCGRPPFRADSLWDLLRQHQFVEPQRPSTLAPNVPPALEVVIATLLAKEPAHRYQSADELLVALTQVMGQIPSSAFARTRHALLPAPVSPARRESLLRSEAAARSGPISVGPELAAGRSHVESLAAAPVAAVPTTLSLGAAVRHSGPQQTSNPEDARGSARGSPRAWRSTVAVVLLSCAVVGLLSIVLVRSQPAAVVASGHEVLNGDAAGPPGHPDALLVVAADRETRAGEVIDAGVDAGIAAAHAPRHEEQRPARSARAPEAARSGGGPATSQAPPGGRASRPTALVSGTAVGVSEGSAASDCENAGKPEDGEAQARWHAKCGRLALAGALYERLALAVRDPKGKIRLLELARDQYFRDGNSRAEMIARRIGDLERAQ
jgi:serine/threonine-protein kinase